MEIPTLFDTSPDVLHAGHSVGVLPRVTTPHEHLCSIEQLAKAAGVCDRTVRRWVRSNLLAAPMVVSVPGTAVRLKRWPLTAIAAVRELAAEREIWLRRR